MKDFDLQKFKENCQTLLTRAEKRIADLKKSSLEYLKDENSDRFYAESFADKTNMIGFSKGYARIMREMLKAHEKVEKFSLALYLGRWLTNSTRDTWSGRGNDFRRSVLDGEKRAIGEVLDLLEYGSCLSL